MKTLSTLIRLQKQRLDALRRRLAVLQNQRSALEEKDTALMQELQRELELGSQQPEMGGFFGNFAARIKQKRIEIATEIIRIDQFITAATDQIRESFADMKRYEIALELRKKAEITERQRKETNRLDEVAAQRHNRKKESRD